MTTTTHTLKLLKAKIEGRIEILESLTNKVITDLAQIKAYKKVLKDIEELLKEDKTDYSTQL